MAEEWTPDGKRFWVNGRTYYCVERTGVTLETDEDIPVYVVYRIQQRRTEHPYIGLSRRPIYDMEGIYDKAMSVHLSAEEAEAAARSHMERHIAHLAKRRSGTR